MAFALLSLSCANSQVESWCFVVVDATQGYSHRAIEESQTLEERSVLATVYVERRYRPKKGYPSDASIYAEGRLNCRIPHSGAECERDVLIPVYCDDDPLSGFGCEL